MPVACVGGVRAARRTPVLLDEETLRADAVAEGAPERTRCTTKLLARVYLVNAG